LLFAISHNAFMPRSKSKLEAATLGGTPDDIEAAFYEAMQAGDIEKLMACWADEDDVVCIHPGGPRLIGAGAIRAAFDTMFSHGGSIHAKPEHIRRVDSLASAVHHVLEKVEVLTADGPAQAYVLATNVYHKAAQGWRLVVHHASPGTQGEANEISQPPQVLH
jgi:uncharacterized protein (TIGR02246 family)